jgi:hypothetical protein
VITSGAAASRRLVIGRALLGSVLVLEPGQLLRFAAGRGEPAVPAWLARILGGRILVQSAVEFIRPTRGVLLAGALIDVAHATSMIPFMLSRRHRRIALASAALAAGTAALSIRVAAGIPPGGGP